MANDTMKRDAQIVLQAGSVILLVFIFTSAFLFSPPGWNLVPLMMLALVLGASFVRWRAVAAERRAVEIIPPEAVAPDASAIPPIPAANLPGRLNRAFGPIAAGMIIDLVDFATFGPIGLVLGMPVGGLVGYWMGRAMGLGKKGAFWCALASGIYCTIPGTELIPLATIVGACVRFYESGQRRPTP